MGDCDPAGIVFFPRYLAIFDACTWALFTAALGMKKPALLAHFGTVGCPMVDLRVRFLIPCTFGDEVVVDSRIAELRRSSFDVQAPAAQGRRAGGRRVGDQGLERGRFGRPGRLRSQPIPPEVRARLSA